jgi:aryl-alcohol dehydrogenase-like predicted oxidoreductase
MELVLGTAQFGLNYGVSNTRGRTPVPEIESILSAARDYGIELLDTAATYGDAEDVLSRVRACEKGFRIISKTASLSGGLDAVIERTRVSIENLGRPLDTLLVHSATDLFMADGPALWEAMRSMNEEGAVRRIGVSVYARDPIVEIAERFRPAVIQLPASVIDQRLVRNGTLGELATRGIEIHVRSVFHQGLIFIDPEKLPLKLRQKREAVQQMQRRLAATGMSPVEAALSYLASLPEISATIVGVTRKAELDEIFAAIGAGRVLTNARELAIDDSTLLDPTRW